MPSEDGYQPDDAVPVAAPGPGGASAESRIHGGLDELAGLASRPLPEHAPVYEALHEQLQDVLAEIDGA